MFPDTVVPEPVEELSHVLSSTPQRGAVGASPLGNRLFQLELPKIHVLEYLIKLEAIVAGFEVIKVNLLRIFWRICGKFEAYLYVWAAHMSDPKRCPGLDCFGLEP